mmetsp:Transcript_85119/g.189115  ORF Transcript_85119/g.189115 Transcript_85119/m.189115 type:complete len:465 (-) Transcript_85119:120-1514(-)
MGEASPSQNDFTPISSRGVSLSDPLGDVIDWLGTADLGDDLPDREDADDVIADGAHRQAQDGFDGIVGASAGAKADEPPIFAGRPKASTSSRTQLGGYCGLLKEPDARNLSGAEPEEEEWDARQQQTGAAGRLVIYTEGDHPRVDFLLRGGGTRRIMVTAVTEGGKASQAGVKAGDVLVSIDGKKDFKGLSADAVHAGLKAPVMLVFMGFVGKLQAEVRLNYKPKICGFPSKHQVVRGRPEAPVQVVDEVIFQPGTATLFLAIEQPRSHSAMTGRSFGRCDGQSPGKHLSSPGETPLSQRPALNAGDQDVPDGEACDTDEGSTVTTPLGGNLPFPPKLGDKYAWPAEEAETQEAALAGVYELRGPEARILVNKALSLVQPPIWSTGQDGPRSPGDHDQRLHTQPQRGFGFSVSQFGGSRMGPDGRPLLGDAAKQARWTGSRASTDNNAYCDAEWWGDTCPRSHE